VAFNGGLKVVVYDQLGFYLVTHQNIVNFEEGKKLPNG
jgi:hypothetical protein